MRTTQQKQATKLRKAAEREAHRERVFKKYPPQVRYAKKNYKKGTKRRRRNKSVKIGIQ